MKSKYMSRKFILAVLWLVVAIIGLAVGNNMLVIFAQIPTVAFILGESFIDSSSSVKREQSVSETHYVDSEYLREKKDVKRD